MKLRSVWPVHSAKAGAVKVGVSRGGKISELDQRIYRAGCTCRITNRCTDYHTFVC